jgi:hypothetical protein
MRPTMNHRIYFGFVVALLALSTACLNSNSSKCGDVMCPSNMTCMSGSTCVDSDLVLACVGLADGATCNVPGYPPNVCAKGVCQASRCGDGRITGAEQCDGTDMQNHTCMDEGFYSPTGLACGSNCMFDTSACVGRCGDGIKNGPELCDGPDMGTATCFDVGYYAAPGLKCKSDCTFDATACTGGHCGDGIINGLEECDGAEMGSASCVKLGYTGSLSILSCTKSCTYSSSSCLCTTGRCTPGSETCSCSKTGCGCAAK